MHLSAPRPPPLPPGTWQGLPVAVKTVVFSATDDRKRRALQEAALCQSICHPNIVVGCQDVRQLALQMGMLRHFRALFRRHRCVCHPDYGTVMVSQEERGPSGADQGHTAASPSAQLRMP